MSEEDNLLDQRAAWAEYLHAVTEALGFRPARQRRKDGHMDYHFPRLNEVLKHIQNPDALLCVSHPHTVGCKRSSPAATAFEHGWRKVAHDWWCDACMERYGFIHDSTPPEDSHMNDDDFVDIHAPSPSTLDDEAFIAQCDKLLTGIDPVGVKEYLTTHDPESVKATDMPLWRLWDAYLKLGQDRLAEAIMEHLRLAGNRRLMVVK